MKEHWMRRLEGARDAEAVVEIAKDFLFMWSPSEIEELPEAARPPEITTSDDVSGYAFALGEARCKDEQLLPELQEMATFFSAASNRLSQIYATARATNSGRFFTTR